MGVSLCEFESRLRHKTRNTHSIAGFHVFDSAIDIFGLCMSEQVHPYKLAELYPKNVRSKGRYYIKFSAWDINDKKLKTIVSWCPVRYKTEKEAKEWAKEEIARINAVLLSGGHFGKIEPAKKVVHTIKTIFPELLKNRKDTFRKRSYDTYKTALKKIIAFLDSKQLEGLQVGEFTNLYLSDFIDYLIGIGNSNSTINNVLELVGWFFEQCVNKEIIEKKPYRVIKLKETQSAVNVAFTLEHQRILENWLLENDYELYLFTRFVYHAFIRPRELKALQVVHIDFDRRGIIITGAISKNRKNDFVPINTTLYPLLKNFVGKTGFLFGRNMCIGDKIKCQENEPYNRHAAALLACGLNGLGYSLYSWKHTGAVRAYQSGVDIKKLQRLLRHSSLSITDIYLRSLNVITDIENLAGW